MDKDLGFRPQLRLKGLPALAQLPFPERLLDLPNRLLFGAAGEMSAVLGIDGLDVRGGRPFHLPVDLVLEQLRPDAVEDL